MQPNAIALAVVIAAGSAASAQSLTTEAFAGGFARPVQVVSIPGDFDRVFVVEQRSGSTGRVRVVDRNTGAVAATPFLTRTVTTGNEQGLLGMAFHPDYATNGKLYINYTNNLGQTIIEEWLNNDADGNPDVADGLSQRVLSISQPFSNHNAGWLGFSPSDGYLYIPMGDGGSANDPGNRSQNLDELLGKILRIDVDGDDFPADANTNYAIPADNPFFGPTSGRDEIWASGLRNPYRCSFDPATGDFYLGDVGQNAREELNYQLASSAGGENYGWRCWEGNILTPGVANTCGPASGITFPILDYTRVEGNCSIIGGEVYRGCAIPDLEGTYFYADFCSSNYWSIKVVNGVATEFTDRDAELRANNTNPAGFGVDAYGEIYICSLGGTVRRIVPAAGIVDTNDNGVADTCEAPAGCNAADIAEEFGVLNANDIIDFVNGFNSANPIADVSPLGGDGLFNANDIIDFVNAFNAGCP